MKKKLLCLKMKRHLAGILSAALVMSLLAGCGNKADEAPLPGIGGEAMETPMEEPGTPAFDMDGADVAGEASAETPPVKEAEVTNGAQMAAESAAMADTARGDCYPYYEGSGEEYEKPEENGYYIAAVQPFSTFSADVDTASYANVRRMIEDGYSLHEINPDAVRPEEFINYFSYDLNYPKRGDKFGVTTEMAPCPWNKDHYLLMVGMRTQAIDMKEAPNSNLVFLLDVSGSMADPDKLPLLQESFKDLTAELTEKDTVSIVTYANGVEVVLKGVKGSDKDTIIHAIDSLYASGGTYGEGGIQKAYEIAEANFIEGGNNRIILATDGDLNIGVSDPDELERLIEKKRKSGVYLSVLGFGTGNIKDNKMERLADCGNGNYAYIDSRFEAKKVLVEEMGSTLVTVADDVKLQVEFNPGRVNAYRLIGYENRMLDTYDFIDDTKDAGEIGAGHTVVALYEIIPVGSRDVITSKYQEPSEDTTVRYPNEYATVHIRYKEPGESKSQEKSYVVKDKDFTKNPSDDFVFASLAAEFAMILSDSPHKGNATLDGILETYDTLDVKGDEYKEEFRYLVRLMAKR